MLQGTLQLGEISRVAVGYASKADETGAWIEGSQRIDAVNWGPLQKMI